MPNLFDGTSALLRPSKRTTGRLSAAAGAIIAALMSPPLTAAEVTFDRLKNAESEPGNWITNHKTYDAKRFSPLDQINQSNIKNLHVAFVVQLGGSEPGGDKAHSREQSTPLVEDGFLYMTDGWDDVYKIDVRDGKKGRIVWKMDPAVDKSTVWLPSNRGVALYGNQVIVLTTDGRVIAMDKDTGKVLWDKNYQVANTDVFTSAPLIVKDMIIVPGSGADIGGRCWLMAIDAKTGKVLWRTYSVPAPGEPGHETWADDHDAWKTGGGAFWYVGAYDPATNLMYWGTGQPTPMFDADYRPGDNLYTNSTLAIDADTGKIVWYFQYTPNDKYDYDEVGSQMIYDVTINGEPRKILGHFGRNGFFYTLDRTNGSFISAAQYVKNLNWTKGIDPKTGKPVEYDPSKKLQQYAVASDRASGQVDVCPDVQGGVNFFPTAWNPSKHVAYGAGIDGCAQLKVDESRMGGPFWNGGVPTRGKRMGGQIAAIDMTTGKVKAATQLDYPDYAGMLATAGGLVFTGTIDGTFTAFDDEQLKPLWNFNVGSAMAAPPISYSVGGKQYIAIHVGGGVPWNIGLLKAAPELENLEGGSSLFVFALD
jgi:alcohol dehydrogenase (cytochrome c)